MTRAKKIEQEAYIRALIRLFIEQRGYFDSWLDGDTLFPLVAITANCSLHKVKRIFYKVMTKEDKEFLAQFRY